MTLKTVRLATATLATLVINLLNENGWTVHRTGKYIIVSTKDDKGNLVECAVIDVEERIFRVHMDGNWTDIGYNVFTLIEGACKDWKVQVIDLDHFLSKTIYAMQA